MPIPRAYLAAWAAAMIAFLALDIAWLSLVGIQHFAREVGPLLRPDPDLGAAGAFYLIYITGLTVLAVIPALADRSLVSALWKGALLGLTAYATFDLTNLSVIKGWTLSAAALDMAWGTVGSALAAAAAYGVGTRVGLAPDLHRQ